MLKISVSLKQFNLLGTWNQLVLIDNLRSSWSEIRGWEWCLVELHWVVNFVSVVIKDQNLIARDTDFCCFQVNFCKSFKLIRNKIKPNLSLLADSQKIK